MNEYEFHSSQNPQSPSEDASQQQSAPQPETVSFEDIFPPKPEKKPRKSRSALKICALALCFSLLGSIIGAGGLLTVQHFMEKPVSQQSPAISNGLVSRRPELTLNEVAAGEAMTPAQIYAANVNSTVGITTSVSVNYWGYSSTASSAGSGFILTEDGYMITNYHVVEDSDSISVALYDGKTYTAELIGYDESLDLAVIKADATGLSPVVLGSSDTLNVGDTVLAIGNPLGELTFSQTVGTISAKDRRIAVSNTLTMELLQTDCAINSGNSGGPLFNIYGEVVGITNAKYSSNGSGASIDNIGFAIPIDNVMHIVESIIEKGYISKSYVGLYVSNVSPDVSKFGIPVGAYVEEVSPGGPADQAGIKAGDIITHADGKELSTGTELVNYVGRQPVGASIVFTVFRSGQTLELTAVTAEQVLSATGSESSTQQPSSSQQQQHQQQQSGDPFSGWPWSGMFGN